MAQSTGSGVPLAIYILGVPATGKATLVEALAVFPLDEAIREHFVVIPEVATELVLNARIQHRDIQAGTDAAINLQRRILEVQAIRERETAKTARVIVSDRSGVDPIAFATKYGGNSCGQALLNLEAWKYLRQNMRRGLVILCEPMPQWFVNDGVRIVPTSSAEMNELHSVFCDILKSQGIPFKVLPASIESIQERVDFVRRCWNQVEKVPSND